MQVKTFLLDKAIKRLGEVCHKQLYYYEILQRVGRTPRQSKCKGIYIMPNHLGKWLHEKKRRIAPNYPSLLDVS